MALNITRSDLSGFMEVNYNPATVMSQALKKSPLTTFLPKKTSAGLNLTTRMLLREAGNPGATLTDAISFENDPGIVQVIQTWKNTYTAFSIEDDAIIDTEKKSAMSAAKLIVESTLRRHGDVLESLLWGTGQGWIGRIATGGITGNVVTLTNPSDVWNFEVGQSVRFGDVTGTSMRTGTDTVLSIQYAAGTITMENLGDITSEAAGDYMFFAGYQAHGSMGIRSWLVDAATTGDAFGTGSLDRYPYGERATGWKYTASSGMTNREGLIKGLAYGENFGGHFDVVFGNTARVADLTTELSNNVVWDGMTDKKLGLNFRGVRLAGPQGEILVIGAPKCPTDSWFVLERDTWELHHVGELIRNPLHSGKFLDAEVEDGVKGRWKTRWGLACVMPSHNGRIVMA